MSSRWLVVLGAWCGAAIGCSSGDDGTAEGGTGGAGATSANMAGAFATGGGGSAPLPAAGGTGRGGSGAGGGAGAGAAAGSSDGGRAGSASGGSMSGSGGSATGGQAPGGGGSAAGSGGAPSSPGCASVGETIVIEETIEVASGEVFDGKCKRYVADPESVGDGSQEEGQKPMFELADGATLINVVLGAPAADGIHTKGDATLKSIVWQDIGEDALTVGGEGTVVLDGGSAQKGEDKVFQINAASTFKVSNFVAKDAGKFIRQNGGTDFAVKVFIDRCDISNMDEAIFRTDSSSSTVSMTNTRYSAIGDELFMGVSESNIVQQNNTQY